MIANLFVLLSLSFITFATSQSTVSTTATVTAEPLDQVSTTAAVTSAPVDQISTPATGASASVDQSSSNQVSNIINWPMAGLDSHATRYQANSLITKQTANSVHLAWSFNTETSTTNTSGVSATPTVYNGFVYFPTWSNKIYCIRESDGAVIWVTNFSSRTSGTIAGPLIIFGQLTAAKVAAFDLLTGHQIWITTLDDYIYATITQSGLYKSGVFYVGTSSFEELIAGEDPNFQCCHFTGHFVALNAFTGNIIWKTRTITADGFYGAPVWGSSPAYLETVNYVYFTTGNNYKVPQSVANCVNNLTRGQDTSKCNVPGNLGDSIVAVNATNGHIVWSHQLQGIDYYTDACWYNPASCEIPLGPDYDFDQGPLLYSIPSSSSSYSPSPASSVRWILGAGAKSGVFYAYDAVDGSPVWRTAVGPGGGYGGLGWGSSVNDDYIFVSLINDNLQTFTILGHTYCNGGWAALSKANGTIKWFTSAKPQIPEHECSSELGDDAQITTYPVAFGPVSSTSEVMIGTSFVDGYVVILDEDNGHILWEWSAGVTIQGGVSITRNSIYVGAGYGSPITYSEQSNKFYAFRLS